MSGTEKEYGEGNYKASRQYNEATKKFVESGQVDEAARQAAPNDAAEASQMKDAEAKGRSRAKEEDPALHRGATQQRDPAAEPRGNTPIERSAENTKTPEPGHDKE